MDILSIIATLCALVALSTPLWVGLIDTADEQSYTDRRVPDLVAVDAAEWELRMLILQMSRRNPRQQYWNSSCLLR